MISLLGKRPFTGKADDMDKWLDSQVSASRFPIDLITEIPQESC
jgi:hypothetical protein